MRTFRPEIQLLRAVAVLTVVVYHFNPAVLPGGFVGVDVFFVISGFLITSHMLRELESTGRLSLRKFWANRARRILPAALTVIAVTSLAATVVIPLPQLASLSTQALASVFYVQNFVLANKSVDYLQSGAADTPFEHFWSLSVEEQFCLFWPLLAVAAMLAARLIVRAVRQARGRPGAGAHPAGETSGTVPTSPATNRVFRTVVTVLFASVVVASFVYSVQLVGAHDPKAYFVTGARVWELGVGGLLACLAVDTQRFPAARLGLMLAGLGTIAWACVTYAGQSFPGAAALAPVLGTAAVIVAGKPVSFLAPAVQFAPVQAVGNWSYSLYLWHFPVITFFAVRTGEYVRTVWEFAALFAVSLVLAVGSYYLLEQPLRLNVKLKKRPAFALVSAGVAMVLGAGLAVVPQTVFNVRNGQQAAAAQAVESKGYATFGGSSMTPSSFSTFVDSSKAIVPQPAEAVKDVPEFPGCVRVPSEAKDSWTPECAVGDQEGTKTLVVVGDSHASQWVPALEEVYKNTNWKIVTMLHNACPFSLAQRGFEKYGELQCTGPNSETLQKILKMKPDRVIMSNRSVEDYDKQDGETYAGEKGFEEVLEPMKKAGIRVTVISPTPERGSTEAVPDCVSLNMSDPNKCGVERAAATVKQDTTNAMRTAAVKTGVEWIDMTSSFCHKDTCPAVVGSVLVYRDDNHITATYMRTIAGNLATALGVTRGQRN